jgi:LIN37
MTNPFMPPPNMMGYLPFPPPPFPYGASGPFFTPPWVHGQFWPGPTATNKSGDATNQAMTNSLQGFSYPYAFPTPGMQWHQQFSIPGPGVAPPPTPPRIVPPVGMTNSPVAGSDFVSILPRPAPKGRVGNHSKLAKKIEAPTGKCPTQAQTTVDRSVQGLHPKSAAAIVPASTSSKPKPLKSDRHLAKALKQTKASLPSQVQKPVNKERLLSNDMTTVILDESSNCFRIFDRRIHLNAFADNSSVYSLLRAWVQDDPQRYTPPQASNLKDSALVSSQRRFEAGELDGVSLGNSLGKTGDSFDKQDGDKVEVVDICKHKQPIQMQVLKEMHRYAAGANSSSRPTSEQFFAESSGRKRQRARKYKRQRDVVKKKLRSMGIDV